ncbi:diaminopimelate epimerase [Luteibaculum oceani]|uniref:Diaminopimelate epimerase n=1 Tax=Luteibaculum oceani TaxID=1294296 RepID=A0A5C6V9G8_9FLAO|nr:diaminopimelate epimerase [Luteibaculum oceani]TXC81380.1 diaminopimelate epimerase [Luteibaculum oceani]
MKLNFHKYQGAGNDFVIINALEHSIQISASEVSKICDRKYGVGADGLMILSHRSGVDFHLDYFNADGSVSFCGNGSRCAVRFYHHLTGKEAVKFSAFDGKHLAFIEQDLVKLEMMVPQKGQWKNQEFIINTGAPHVCVSVNNLDDCDIYEIAKPIRWRKEFAPVGVNVNLFEKIGGHQVKMRTFEKGVEDETLACGTGVTAVAISVLQDDVSINSVLVETKGGKLKVDRKGEGTFWLTGPATFVFRGEIAV